MSVLKLNDRHALGFLDQDLVKKTAERAEKAYQTVYDRSGAGNDFLGWLDLPEQYDHEEFMRVKAAAEKIKRSCDIFVVIGIGGSYLGARAAIEFVKSPLYNNLKKGTPEIYFAGNGINSAYLNELLSICEGKNICINVISKSGKTTEPAVAFRIFRGLLEKKYGEEGARERIFITTDSKKGKLKELADEKGYETFVVPDDVGGRYSVLTSVGLLPIAVAGIDIDDMMRGAADARKEYAAGPKDNDCVRYATIRNCLYESGKGVEILVTYDPALALFNEWWKQLYGESEGKDNKGLYPSSVVFSTDLHSLGQYIQQGTRNIFETVLNIETDFSPVVIPDDPNNIDELNFVSGKTLHEVNANAFRATLLAHVDGGVPNMVFDLRDRSAYSFGWMVYFFELACAISGYTLDVNPFDQPGVEGYKNNMYALLGKPGAEHEKRRAELLKRL